tara:strand:+ start:365 stop:1438 length:1074 start_codon:yes stop_codon:yes gene_type:complete
MITVLIGTKAQLVKMAPIIRELRDKEVPYRFVLTGQHAETMGDLIDSFGIRSADDILVENGESDTQMKLITWLYFAIKAVRRRKYFKNDTSVLVVHGDTLSTLFGTVLGWMYGIPVAHIEAGLRSFNFFNPFPEELIRVIVSRLSDVHYCSSDWALKNLRSVKKGSILINTKENTILDSLRYSIAQMKLSEYKKTYAVVSLHRHENLSNPTKFKHMMSMLISIADMLTLKFILHPVTKNKLQASGWYEKLARHKNIELKARMDYVTFTSVLASSKFLITDGGSNQEEAYHMGLPCLLFREKTERNEGLGSNVVISNYNEDVILNFVKKRLVCDWRLKKLPDVYPSAEIVKHLTLLSK